MPSEVSSVVVQVMVKSGWCLIVIVLRKILCECLPDTHFDMLPLEPAGAGIT